MPDGEIQLFSYDTENQLSTATLYKTNGEVHKWRYTYDPFGRRLSKERIDKGSLKSTEPKRTVFIWDGSKVVQEYNYKGTYTYIYTDQDSYEPLAHVFHNLKDNKLYLSYYHNDQIGIPREQTDQLGNVLWLGEYDAWGSLKEENKIYPNAHQPFRLQNQYCDEETGLHYNLFRYYDPRCGRFVNQDPIGLAGGEHLYAFANNAQTWIDPLGLMAGLVKLFLKMMTKQGTRPGKDFTKAGKLAIKQQNKADNNGQMKCTKCGRNVIDAQKHQKGVTPPSNEAHVDHIIAKSRGGSGTVENGQILCRICNLEKSNK